MRKISVVCAILNEEKNIPIFVKKLEKNLVNYIYEIIFVDDNSSDNTASVIKSLKKNKIKYILRKSNKDISQSCILGIKKTKYKNILIMDSDLQHNPKYLPAMLNIFFSKKYDFLVGVRDFSNLKGLSPVRRIGSKILCFLYNFFLGYKVSDPMTGFFIFKKYYFFKYKKNLFGKGWKLLSDLIYNGDNLKIKEFKIQFDKRIYHESKMNFGVLINVIKLLFFKLYLNHLNFFVKRN